MNDGCDFPHTSDTVSLRLRMQGHSSAPVAVRRAYALRGGRRRLAFALVIRASDVKMWANTAMQAKTRTTYIAL